MVFKSPKELAKNIEKTSLNAPTYSLWVKGDNGWKLHSGRDSSEAHEDLVNNLKTKGYGDYRVVPNGENWDYETPKGYIDPSGYEWFDDDAKEQALSDWYGYSNDLQKYYDEGNDVNAQFMQDYLKYRNRAYDYLKRNKLI